MGLGLGKARGLQQLLHLGVGCLAGERQRPMMAVWPRFTLP